jgi:hypothetical protein
MNKEVPEKVKYVNDVVLGIGGERVEIYSLPQCPNCESYPTYNVNPCPFCEQRLIYPEGVEVEDRCI